MMKLTILCLLVATALAMPVADNEKKEEQPAPKSVVPLESKPTEGVVGPNAARAIDGAEKKIDEALPKKMDEMKKDEMKKDEMRKDETKKDEMKKDEMKKDEMKKDEIKKDEMKKDDLKKDELKKEEMKEEEKKPMEESKKLEEEKKPEIEAKSAEKHHDQAVIEGKDLIKETPLAGAVEIPAAAPGAAEVAIEPAQAKNIEEAPLLIEKKSSEPAKELPKPDEMRVTREAEEAAKKLEADKKLTGDDEKKPLEKLAAEAGLKTVESSLPEAAKPKEEEKQQPKIEAAVADIKDAGAAAPEAKSVQPLKSDVAKEQRSEDASGKVAGVENPVVEQRSEVITPIAKEAKVGVVEGGERAIPAEAAKEVAGVVAEKSAKLTDELKAEELPLPQEVKDAKNAEQLAAKSELAHDKKDEIVPADKKLPEEKKDEKKDASSEEKDSSSEEKKMDEKLMDKKKDEDKKDASSEEKDDSSEEMKIKKEEMIKKEAVTAELSSSPAAAAATAAAGATAAATEAKAPAS